MDPPRYFRLESLSVIDIVGDDADKILHNLTTNDVISLEIDQGCESFVTDARGKTLGHFVVFRTAESLRLIGASGQSEALEAHVDRYTIREDAEPKILDAQFTAMVIPPESVAAADLAIDLPADSGRLLSATIDCGEARVCTYQTSWLGHGTLLMLASTAETATAEDLLDKRGFRAGDEYAFHQRRIRQGFPWYGIDVDESNLPQEADRNEAAISFTKGCYLGQETVARLDALGQVQKKLVRWSIEGVAPDAGAALCVNEKTVGRLTSVASDDADDVVAIGMARRSHFDAGATAEYLDPKSGETWTATVL